MKKIVVDKVKCIGCGMCVGTDPEHFQFEDDGLSNAISQDNTETEALAQAIDACPTGAISVEETKE